jgi:hypothetical protein
LTRALAGSGATPPRSAKIKSCLSALVSLFLAVGFVHGQKADQLSGVAISPADHGWFIQVSPDGSVRASFGSLPQHQIQMQQGSVDFATLRQSQITDIWHG